MRGSLSAEGCGPISPRALPAGPAPEPVVPPDAAIAAAIEDLRAGRTLAARARLPALLGRPDLDCGRAHLIGLIALGAGAPAEALAAFDASLAAGGTDPATHYNRGNALKPLGRIDAAAAAYDAALRLRPAYPDVLRAAGVLLRETNRLEAAIPFFCKALQLKPDFGEAALDLGGLLQDLGETETAVAIYEKTLGARPRDGELLNNLGVALQRLGRPADALVRLDAALAAAPNLPAAQFNRGNVLLQLQRPDEALAAFDRALALKPGYVEALCSRAVALKYCERFDDALAAFDVALAADPASAHAKNNKAALLLLRGDFTRGFEDYEFRWIAANTPKQALARPTPEWAGVTRPGDRILVYDEQGLGDVLQFCRYLPLLVAQRAEVTFQCRPKLHRLLESLPVPVRLVADVPAGEAFDHQIAMSSLPRAFGTRLDTVPAATPYLRAEAARVRRWRDWLGAEGLRIGVCWQGNPDPKADPSRSIPLAAFAPLAAVPSVRLIAVQRVNGLDAVAALPPGMAVAVPELDAGPDAFVDTAALMQNLDLIVTCDTSIAHLAGALGRPVWVLLKKVPDWRFMLQREDSPWYPSMRLFRQAHRNDWSEVFSRVAAAAQALRDAASV